MDDTNFISPEDVRGFSKALPRKQVRKGRERGRSTVITETPEKDKLIEKERSKPQKGKRNIGELQEIGANESTCKTKKMRKRRRDSEVTDTSEDSSDYEVLSENEDWVPDEVEKDNSIVTKEDILEGQFILIKFPRKIFYVAKVIGVTDNDFEVSFLRKSVKHFNCFLFSTMPDISFISLNEIAMILLEPVPGTTKRQPKMYKFGINFSSVNIR